MTDHLDKRCETCKFFIEEKTKCTNYYWATCIVRDLDGYVIDSRHHQPQEEIKQVDNTNSAFNYLLKK